MNTTSKFTLRAALALLVMMLTTATAWATVDVTVNVTGSGSVSIGNQTATEGNPFTTSVDDGASVTLTIAPDAGNIVTSAKLSYKPSEDGTAVDDIAISGSTATFQMPNDIWNGTGVTINVTFGAGLVGGADEASAVALTDATVSNLAGGYYKVESDISFDHTLNLIGDTYLVIASGAKMTVSSSEYGINGELYALNVLGEGTLNVTTTGSWKIAVSVSSYTQSGCSVNLTTSYMGMRCSDSFNISGGSFKTNGSEGIWPNNDVNISGGKLEASNIDANINLSYSNTDDYIKVDNYTSGMTMTIANGQTFTDGTNNYSGTITNLSPLNGKKLFPFVYKHLTVRDATCTEVGIKQECWQRSSDGKYFSDENGTTELNASDVETPMIAHNGVPHEATDTHIAYWQCSMCSKYFSEEGCTTEITEEDTKIYRTITIDGSISGLVTSNVDKAVAGTTVTLTVSHLIDASTLRVNDGNVALTDAGNGTYTFKVPAADVTVTASTATTYSVNLPANMEIVSATTTADGDGKYISGTVVTFKASFSYTASNVSDGANTLTADGSGNYSVTVGTADITVTATIGHSSNIDLSQAPSDFTVVDGDVLTGSTSHTVTIADGAGITLSGATISGGIVCAGSAEITLVGTNNVSNTRYSSAGIRIGSSTTTLTIRGDGSLTATGGSQAAGIGLGRTWDANAMGGSIVIEGGTVTASGGNGIGTGNVGNSQTATIDGISIKGGTVSASLGKGYIYNGSTATVGYIKIYDTIDMVDASKITETVTYMHVDGESATDVTANKTDYFTIGENGNRRLIVQKPVIAEIAEQAYTGSEIKPEPTVTIGSITLTKGTDYVYSYTNNTNVGTATVRVTFQGTYASLGYVEKTFTIAKATPTVTAPTAIADLVYNGSPQALVTAGSTDFGTLIYSTDGANYSADIPTATDAGTYTVYYKVEEGDNWYAVAAQTVEVTAIPWSGTGDSEDPYMIYNKDQLLLLAHRVNGTSGETANTYKYKYFKLGADITFSHPDNEGDDYEENYEAIGGYIGGTYRYFKGKFDGDGHTVSGIRIRKDGGMDDIYQGLFGCISSGADIHDVHLTDARITGYYYVGGIVGYNGSSCNVSGCTVTDSYITATITNSNYYGAICGHKSTSATLTNNYYHGCTVNGTAVTSGVGCKGADLTDNNGALPAYRLALGANITTPPGTFLGQTEWLDTPPASARLAPENGFTLAGNHYFASGYEFTPGSTLASGAAQGYTPRATLGGQLLDPYTPTGDTDPLAGTAIARLSITADCDGKTLDAALRSTGQPVTVAYIKADGTPGEASAIALDGTETSLAEGTYFAGLENVNFDHTLNLTGNVTLILCDGCTMNMGTSGNRISGHGIARETNGDQALTIYGQNAGTGALNVYTGNGKKGIVAKAVTINGGNVTTDANGNWATGIYAVDEDITINGGTVNATATGNNTWAIYANNNVTINGGTVEASGTADGIRIDNGTIAINGGTVNASGSYGINANYGNGTITLGWTEPTDRITASSYYGTVQVADGKALTDGSGHIYTGTLSADDLDALAGKTLSGTTEVTLTEDNATQALAAINGMSGIGVTFNRAFTANKPSTICLPFDYTKNEGDGSFYAFTSIEHSGGEYIATMTEPGTTTLTANTPYLYLPSAPGNVEFSGTPTTAIAAGSTTSGDWTFQGTYDEVKWDTAPTGIYGFSAQDVSDQGISQGEFVKVGAKVRIRPLRAYLKYKNGTENYSAAPTRGTTAELPDRIIVRLIGSDGNTTAIGTLDTRTGEVEIDTWYDLNGRKLSAKPTHRGIYINNGRKVVIK